MRLIRRGASRRWPPGYRALPDPTHMSVDVHELDTRTRAGCYRFGRLRYRRRLVVVAVLVGLLFATGAFTGIVREGGG